MLEFYLGGIFALIPFTRDRGIWCDGIVDLKLTRLLRCSFLLKGAAYCPHGAGPFELAFHFANRLDLLTNRIVFRFGTLDHAGELRLFSGDNKYQKHWPQSIDDWAVYVELTPE